MGPSHRSRADHRTGTAPAIHAVQRGLPLRDYASNCGSFPSQVEGVGCVGAVTVSGARQREDHQIMVASRAYDRTLAASVQRPHK
jgi:uncharacterized protein (UPF0303 family)